MVSILEGSRSESFEECIASCKNTIHAQADKGGGKLIARTKAPMLDRAKGSRFRL